MSTNATANPAPLGLIGFGMTTVLLNIHNSGITELDTTVMGMGIFVGGLAQVIAGIMESGKGNTFGFTAFTSYGFFWMSLVAIWIMPSMGLDKAQAPTAASMGYYLMFWGIYTFGMFIATLKKNRISQTVFGGLTLLFFLLAAADFSGSVTVKHIAGYVGIFTGLAAIYDSMGQVINETYGKEVLPLG
ncbi:MAG: acetate uptake transporter [Ichthyobacteriaceae bacterium]|nr:acetate uptake transporter [Ichthyobacteriaceae bacterium]